MYSTPVYTLQHFHQALEPPTSKALPLPTVVAALLLATTPTSLLHKVGACFLQLRSCNCNHAQASETAHTDCYSARRVQLRSRGALHLAYVVLYLVLKKVSTNASLTATPTTCKQTKHSCMIKTEHPMIL